MYDKIAKIWPMCPHQYDGKPKVLGHDSGARFINKTESNGGIKYRAGYSVSEVGPIAPI